MKKTKKSQKKKTVYYFQQGKYKYRFCDFPSYFFLSFGLTSSQFPPLFYYTDIKKL